MSDKDLRKLEVKWLESGDLNDGIRFYREAARTRRGCPRCGHPTLLRRPFRKYATEPACALCGTVYVPGAAGCMADELELRLKEQAKETSEPESVQLPSVTTTSHDPDDPFLNIYICTVLGCAASTHDRTIAPGWTIIGYTNVCGEHATPDIICQTINHTVFPWHCPRCFSNTAELRDARMIVCAVDRCLSRGLSELDCEIPPEWAHVGLSGAHCPAHVDRQSILACEVSNCARWTWWDRAGADDWQSLPVHWTAFDGVYYCPLHPPLNCSVINCSMTVPPVLDNVPDHWILTDGRLFCPNHQDPTTVCSTLGHVTDFADRIPCLRCSELVPS